MRLFSPYARFFAVVGPVGMWTVLSLSSCSAPVADCSDSPTPTAKPNATPTSAPTSAPTPTPTSSPVPTVVTSCGNLDGASWSEISGSGELTVRYTDVQPQFGSCIGVEVINNGGDKASWAAHLEYGTSVESLTHFSGGSVQQAGSRMTLRPAIGDALGAGETASFCYCTNPGRAYPFGVTTQWFPGTTSTYQGLPTVVGGSYHAGTLVDGNTGIVLGFEPISDVRGPVGSCASLTFTNNAANALNIAKVDITLNGSGVSPSFWPDFVTVNEGGSQLTIDFPNSWMPLEAGKTLPLTLCMGGRMPASAVYTMGALEAN